MQNIYNYNILPVSSEEIVHVKMEIIFFHHICFIVLGSSGVTHSQWRFVKLANTYLSNQLER